MSSYTDKLLLHALSLLLSLLSLLAISCFGSAAVECLPGQRSLLLNLKDGFAFEYSDFKLNSWTPGSNCCDWEGVTCDTKSRHIIGLYLSDRGIFGNLSSALFNLTSLQTLDLNDNWLGGPLPQSGFEMLTKLEYIDLSYNYFTGQIPSTIGNLKQLDSLDLSENHLSGRIPQELDSLSFLEVLNVSNNNLVGKIPDGTQFSTFSNTSFQGNSGLCGKPLSKLCDNATPKRIGKVLQSKGGSSSSTYVIGLALFVGLGFGVGIAVVLVLQNVPLKFWKKHDNN